MAVQVETQGQLQEFAAVLRRRRWQVLLPAAFLTTVGVVAAVIVPKKYVVKTRVELVAQAPSSNSPGANQTRNAVSDEIVNAEYQIINHNRIQEVIEELKWKDYLALDPSERWDYVERVVMRNLDVAVLEKLKDRGGTFIDISYGDIDGHRAAEFLNNLSDRWVKEVIDRDKVRLRKEIDVVQDQVQAAFSLWQDAMQRYGDLQQQGQFSLTQDKAQLGFRDEDPVLARLNAGKAEAAKDQAGLATLQAQIAELARQVAAMPIELQVQTAEAAVDLTLQKVEIEKQIAVKQAALKQYKAAHPQYLLLSEGIAELEDQLAKLADGEELASTTITWVPNVERETLRGELDELRREETRVEAHLAALRQQVALDEAAYEERVDAYRRLQELANDRDNKQADYNLKLKQLGDKATQLELLQSGAANTYIFAANAEAPQSPSEPNPWVIVAFSIVAGLALGLALALGLEYSKNCYRAVQDVANVMNVPILGVVGTIVTRDQRARARAQQLVVGASSAVILLGLLWITWAWARKPELLPVGLWQAIEDARLTFR
jgi:capsular polysaccharide biosynthesis protein